MLQRLGRRHKESPFRWQGSRPPRYCTRRAWFSTGRRVSLTRVPPAPRELASAGAIVGSGRQDRDAAFLDDSADRYAMPFVRFRTKSRLRARTELLKLPGCGTSGVLPGACREDRLGWLILAAQERGFLLGDLDRAKHRGTPSRRRIQGALLDGGPRLPRRTDRPAPATASLTASAISSSGSRTGPTILAGSSASPSSASPACRSSCSATAPAA